MIRTLLDYLHNPEQDAEDYFVKGQRLHWIYGRKLDQWREWMAYYYPRLGWRARQLMAEEETKLQRSYNQALYFEARCYHRRNALKKAGAVRS